MKYKRIRNIDVFIKLVMGLIVSCHIAFGSILVDDFENGDGTPMHLLSTGQYQNSFDSGLDEMFTIGGHRVTTARAFSTSDRYEISINDPLDGSLGMAKVSGYRSSTGGLSPPGGGIIWDGGIDGISNNDFGLSPLDLSGYGGVRLNFTEVLGEVWVWLNISREEYRYNGLATEYETVTGPGYIDIFFSDIEIPSHEIELNPGLSVEEILSDVGSIALNFRASTTGNFSVKLDSVEIIPVPEPQTIKSLLLLILVTAFVRYRCKCENQSR